MSAARLVRLAPVPFLVACAMIGAPAPEAPSGAARPPVAVPSVGERIVTEPTDAPTIERGRVVPGEPRFAPARTFAEVRALWVTRFSMVSEASVREMVDRAADAGFNTLLVQVRGRGDAFYRSAIEPLGEAVRERDGFDPLALTISEARARGLAVHAWVNVHVVWDLGELPRSPGHLVHARPAWLGVPRELGRELHALDPHDPAYVAALQRHARENRARIEGLFTSPSHPEVKERIRAVWIDLLERYDLDGLHLDYIRFPSDDFDYSAGALSRFRSWVVPELSPEVRARLLGAERTDPYALVDALPEAWSEFRRAQVDELVRTLYATAKERRPEVVVSAAVVADAEEAYAYRMQDWRRWLATGTLDVAIPMAYTPDDRVFSEQIRVARAAAGERRRVWAGIGAYKNTLEGTLDKVDAARRERAGGVVIFSYDWAVTEGTAAAGEPFLERVGRSGFGR